MTALDQAWLRRRRAPARPLLQLCLAAMLLASCGGAPVPTATPTPRTLVIRGLAEAAPLLRELASTFAYARPGLTVTVEAVTAEESLAGVSGRWTDIGIVSSVPQGDRRALTYTEVARQPIAVLVHQDNPVRNLTLDQLGDIYTGRATEWTSLGGGAMPLMVLSREPGAPLRATLDAALIGPDTRMTPNALLLPSDEAVAATVSRRPEAIGYVAGGQAPAGARILTINGQHPSDLARGKYYPFWLSIVLATERQPSPTVADFIAYVNGRQGQRIISQWGCGAGAGDLAGGGR